ncbi:hypothetical protein [Azotobacter chroococcum]|uniref:hypothetical protein n=1 Tax=Azotobacter chroococcum TaxID=353 RepID=UPI001185913A|nr:hypothetical protein [Azotobacter chroococcum]
MKGILKALVLLVGVGVGRAALAVDYYWAAGASPGIYQSSTPMGSCQLWFEVSPHTYYQGDIKFTFSAGSSIQGVCEFSWYNGSIPQHSSQTISRRGDSCPSGTEYNSSTGTCDAPPSCPETDIYVAVDCTYTESLKLWSCPDEVSQDSCGFVRSPDGNLRCDSSAQICVGRYTGTGEAAGTGADPCTESSCSAVPTASEPACTTYEGTSICIADENTGCGTVNGVEGCFTPEQNCGTYNGTFGCYPQDKPNRNCGFANGEQICFDPNNPTEQIPSISPDHPINGGNADGNENNDPKDPADTSGTASPQGSNSAATNESIDQLGEDLGEKIDKTNSLLDAIKGLLGVEHDDSGEWSDGEAGIAGSDLGQGMGDALGTAVDDAIAARDQEIQTAISTVPSTVDSFFGENGELIPGINSLGDFFPAASGCSDYQIPINAMGFSFVVTLPVCFLSQVKTLIEWVLWCLTAIGVWNIFYSGLRLENAKASKGGY